MKLIATIKPTVYNGHGTFQNAMDRFHNILPSVTCFTVSGYGSYYGTISTRNHNGPEYAYCYNVQVFKRGKHRKNKHYTLYVYKFDLRLLDILKLNVDQNKRNFKIHPKKK